MDPLILILSDHGIEDSANRPRRYLDPPVSLTGYTIEHLVAKKAVNDEKLHEGIPFLTSTRSMRYWGFILSILTILKALPKLKRAEYIVCRAPHLFWEIAFLQRLGFVSATKLHFVWVVLFRLDGFLKKQTFFSKLPRCFRVYFICHSQVLACRRNLAEQERINLLTWKIDSHWFIPKEENAQRKHSTPGEYFLVPGNINRNEAFVRELARVSPRKIVRVGLMKELKHLYAQDEQEQKLSVVVNPDHEEYLKLLQNAKAVLLPINATNEPAGLTAALEAMACKVPLIANGSLGVGELVFNAYGKKAIEGFELAQWLEECDKLISAPQHWETKLQSGWEYIQRTHSMGHREKEWMEFLQLNSREE